MKVHATTIIGLIHNGQAALAGDGQVTFDDTVMKTGAVKIREINDGRILSGFAGAAADALALFELLEKKIDEFSGNLPRAPGLSRSPHRSAGNHAGDCTGRLRKMMPRGDAPRSQLDGIRVQRTRPAHASAVRIPHRHPHASGLIARMRPVRSSVCSNGRSRSRS